MTGLKFKRSCVTSSEAEVIKPGDLVKFAKPILSTGNANHCGVWIWKIGIVILVSRDGSSIVVMSGNKLHHARNRYIKVKDE